MSRIVRVLATEVSAALHSPFVTALRRTETTDTVVVQVHDDDGHVGFGEAPQVWQVTGESLAGARACVEGPLSAVLVGADPDDLVANCRRIAATVAGNQGAKGALDVGLHDLAARRREVSLPVFLGGTTLRVPTDVTLSAGDREELARAARERVADGFTVLKTKVGTDPVADVERVRAIRADVGPQVRLRLDANQGWTPRDAVRVITALESAGADVELVEQPVAAADLDGLAWVTERVGTPVMADEAVYGVRDLVEVIRRRAADLVNVKLAKSGGLSVARTLLELAHSHQVGTMVGSMMETHVGVGAAASLAAAYPTSTACDLDAAWWLSASPVVGGLTYDGPWVVLPDAPGLGITGLLGSA
ncbi:MAG TPA: dipeptide epimerase [Nocardioidaceae bacterium]|nr:dipeptide epimerase [Nocardioidaceae bacterium]